MRSCLLIGHRSPTTPPAPLRLLAAPRGLVANSAGPFQRLRAPRLRRRMAEPASRSVCTGALRMVRQARISRRRCRALRDLAEDAYLAPRPLLASLASIQTRRSSDRVRHGPTRLFGRPPPLTARP